MNRRAFIKLIGTAASVAAIPLALPGIDPKSHYMGSAGHFSQGVCAFDGQTLHVYAPLPVDPVESLEVSNLTMTREVTITEIVIHNTLNPKHIVTKSTNITLVIGDELRVNYSLAPGDWKPVDAMVQRDRGNGLKSLEFYS